MQWSAVSPKEVSFMKVQFQTVDVFTDRQFGGNPVAVIPDARGLSGAQMQAIANEFNLAETTFVLLPADPVNTARVRIFTPRAEMPFAGHPNVGHGICLGAPRYGLRRPFRSPEHDLRGNSWTRPRQNRRCR
jgi:trans-2,3-dihydro-3-hydroxyanthranilate isomerase